MPVSSIPAIVAARRQPGDGSAPWSSPLASLPWDIEDILKCAAGDSTALAAAATACGTRPVVAESACRWFIRHVLFRPGASYYWNLGVERDASIELIRAHYRHLISIFHPDRLQQSDEREWYESFAKRVNEAYNTLKNGDARLKYDRLQNTGTGDGVDRRAGAGHAPTEGKRSGESPDVPPRRAPHPIFARATWRNAPSRGAVPEWIETRRPTTLKVLAFGGVVVLAVGAVALTRAHKSPAADVALPGDAPLIASAQEHEIRLSDLLEKQETVASLAAPSRAAAAADPQTKKSAEPAAKKSPALGASPPNNVAIAPAGARSAEPTAAPAAPRSPDADTPQKAAIAPAVAKTSLPEPTQPIAASRPPVSEPPLLVALVAPAPPPEMAIVEPAPAPQRPTTADVDQTLERFARAYNSGDFRALAALIDPDSARDDRMAFAMANFNRVFHESQSRHIELREISRSQQGDRVSIRLDTRTVVLAEPTGEQKDAGQLTLVVRKRGDAAVITDLRYQSRAGG